MGTFTLKHVQRNEEWWRTDIMPLLILLLHELAIVRPRQGLMGIREPYHEPCPALIYYTPMQARACWNQKAIYHEPCPACTTIGPG